MKEMDKKKVAVVIPCYKVVNHIESVLQEVESQVDWIICVDDACPEGSGRYIESKVSDRRVVVLFHESNQGVGGATLTGFSYALDLGADIMVKVDGDGQMEPSLISVIADPVLRDKADYAKGNRFFYIANIKGMPLLRIFGNLALSFMTKVSTGYWNVFDPTNGFIAINSKIFSRLPINNISRNYFFESDMLFYLGLLGAVVRDVPMKAKYENEKSNLRVMNNIPIFLWGNFRNTIKRIFYSYYLRDFSIGSITLPLSIAFIGFGLWFGVDRWLYSLQIGTPATAGTVLLSALPIILGTQLFLSFLSEDMSRIPRHPISKGLQ